MTGLDSGEESPEDESGIEEWVHGSPESASSSTLPSPELELEERDGERGEGVDGVIIAGETEHEDNFFEESAEGKEFEE